MCLESAKGVIGPDRVERRDRHNPKRLSFTVHDQVAKRGDKRLVEIVVELPCMGVVTDELNRSFLLLDLITVEKVIDGRFCDGPLIIRFRRVGRKSDSAHRQHCGGEKECYESASESGHKWHFVWL